MWDLFRGSSVLEHVLDRSGVGIEDHAQTAILPLVLAVVDVPRRVSVAHRRGRVDHHYVSLREQCFAVLLGDRIRFWAVSEETRLQIWNRAGLDRVRPAAQ